MTRRGKDSEQGTVMVVVMTILIALLAGGAVALYIQVTDTRATTEGGITASR